MKVAQTQTSFFQRVRDAVRKIPYGRITTYGRIAALCGQPRAARQVGWALFVTGDMTIPWQRVVGANGYITIKNPTYTAELQKNLLEKEGVRVGWDKKKHLYKIQFARYVWNPTHAPK